MDVNKEKKKMNRHAPHTFDGGRSRSPSCRLQRAMALAALCAALVLSADAGALAQGRQTGTIRGVALDAQGLALPGVTVRTVLDIRLPTASRRSPFSPVSRAWHTAR